MVVHFVNISATFLVFSGVFYVRYLTEQFLLDCG